MNQQYPNGVQQNQASAYHQTTPGTTRNGYAPAVQQPIPYTVQTQTQTQPQKSAGSKVAVAIVSAVLATLLICFGGFALPFLVVLEHDGAHKAHHHSCEQTSSHTFDDIRRISCHTP